MSATWTLESRGQLLARLTLTTITAAAESR
jgi:hypothetical protein